jgi:hypothetical protein
MKADLCAGGRSAEGGRALGRIAGHEVRESGERPSSPTTSRVGMCVVRGGGNLAGCGWVWWM